MYTKAKLIIKRSDDPIFRVIILLDYSYLCALIFKMGRILAIDYGQKRVGVAVTDENRIIATGLGTWHVKDFMEFLKGYCQKEEVDIIVVGLPLDMKSQDSAAARYVEPFVKHAKKTFPDKVIDRMDERFTSKMAFQTLIDSGLRKKARQNKALIDEVSATILLQSYLNKLANTNYETQV